MVVSRCRPCITYCCAHAIAPHTPGAQDAGVLLLLEYVGQMQAGLCEKFSVVGVRERETSLFPTAGHETTPLPIIAQPQPAITFK